MFRSKTSRANDMLEREISFHIAQMTAANMEKGLSAEDAHRRALVEFGGPEQVKQQIREVHLSVLVEAVKFHLQAARRFLRKSPTFSLAIILTLALGIGANSAVFSAIDTIVLRPLPFPHGDELVEISQHDIHGPDGHGFVAPARVEDWNRMTSAFAGIAGWDKEDISETSGPLPEKLTEAMVTPRFFEVLGIAPLLGRNFTAEEQRFGGPNAALISYGLWKRRFNSDPSVLGKKLHAGRFQYSIVGVMPESFQFPDRDVDLWSPSPPDAPYAQSRQATWYRVFGRMNSGIALNQAAADLATVQNRLGRQFPRTDAELATELVPLKNRIIGHVSRSLWLLYGSVSLLLLIACSNIAALLLARTAEREHEIAVRFSLGASRASIVVQLLAEVLALALAGGLAGLLVAAGAVRVLHLMAKTLPRASEVTLNWSVVGYSLMWVLLTALACGLYPALRGTRRALAKGLAQGKRTLVSARNPMQWTLVGVQVMLAVTLLIGAGLLLHSMEALGRVSPGFDPTHVLTFQITGGWGETANTAALTQRINRTLDGLRTLPGVESAAISATLPGVPQRYEIALQIDGHLNSDHPVLGDVRSISDGYLAVMRIPLLAGEACKQSSSTSDVLVNRTFANLYLAGESAIGHRLDGASPNEFPPDSLIQGIVGDAREEGINEPPMPTVYSCLNGSTPFPSYLVRTQGSPMQMADAIRRRIHELEPARSVYAMEPLEEHLSETLAENRIRTVLLALFAFTAVSLACVGLYGTLSYLGKLRQREVGVRLTLGAQRVQIFTQFLRQGLLITLMGCVAGTALALGLSRFLRGMLYGVSTTDPRTYVSVLALILIVAAFASFAPAFRAARVDPITVLREE